MSDHPQNGVPPGDADATKPQPETHHPPRTIGPYRLLQLVGEGGMGDVWLAEQSHPIRRQVAVKVIKAGMDTAQVVSRFEAERQALALMDHPAIATVYDGGSTPEGRPYFAMEYVKGEPITTYCDRQRLTTQARLELFMQVCEGVQHAHQKGIIHRDLKPSNVFVTIQDDHPVPKIIDFGVAKATAQHLTERTLYTELGVMVGTPEYMSPEQAEMGGLDIDTRTDVYALGVILYELLTGALPFDRKEFRQAGFAEIQRTIREQEPPKPSTRITQLGPASAEAAANRHTEPRRLASELRGDLDWVTMKALEKDRTRRYQTANALAADLRHHLSHEPVSAGPPSTVYRAGKFVRRHRFGVAAAVTLVLLLVAFGVTMAVQAERIARERDRANQESARANQEAETAKQVSEFLVGLFKVSDPGEARGNALTAREVLDRGALVVGRDLVNQPDVQARLQEVLGRVYNSLGLYPRAQLLAEQSYQIRKRVLGPRHPDTLVSLNLLGVAAVQQGDTRTAEAAFREAFEGGRDVLGPAHPQTLKWAVNLAGFLTMAGRLEEAEALDRHVLERRRQTLGDTHQDTLQSINNLAQVVALRGKLTQAEQLQREGLAISRRTLGNDHPETLIQVGNLGEYLFNQQKYTEAEPLLREALRGSLRVLPPEHPDIAYVRVLLAALLNRTARPADAEALVREVMESPANRSSARCTLAESLVAQRRFSEAERVLLASEALRASGNSIADTDGQKTAAMLVTLYETWGKSDKAAEWRAKLPTPAAPAPVK